MATKMIVIRGGTVYVDREDSKTSVVRGGVVYINQETPAAGGATPKGPFNRPFSRPFKGPFA